MAFRLGVIAAGSCESTEDARRLVASMRSTPSGRTPAAVVQTLGALESSGVGEFTPARRPDCRGALLSVPHPEDGVLEALLLLAKDRDLAVYDIRLNRLYDPTGGADVEVSLPGVRLPFLTRDLLADLVFRPDWPDPEAPYVTVDRAAEDFIQVWCDDGSYRLEYRECGAEFHYMSVTDDPAVVIDVMWAWTIRDDSWRGAVPWEFLDLEKQRSLSTPDLDATLDADGTLRIHSQSPAEAECDCEEEWGYTVLAADVPRLVLALGGRSGDDVLDLLAANYMGEGACDLGMLLDRGGVAYRFACRP